MIPQIGYEVAAKRRERRIVPTVHLLERIIGEGVQLTFGSVVAVPGLVRGAHPPVTRDGAQVHAYTEQLTVPLGEHPLEATGCRVDVVHPPACGNRREPM